MDEDESVPTSTNWGFGLVMHGWQVYGRRGITEDDVQRDMGRGGGEIV